MDPTVTRRGLFDALVRFLQIKGIASPEGAIEVLGPPHQSVCLFAIILSERAKPVLCVELMQLTGRLHPTIADVWLLTERESVALLQHYKAAV